MYVDTHAHLTDKRYTDIKSVVDNYLDAKVDFVINVGYDLQSGYLSKKLSQNFDSIYFAAGIHPNDSYNLDKNYLDTLKDILNDEKAVALGEIGLDYHYDNLDKTVQRKVFIEQLELAKSLNLPVIIHSRECSYDMLQLLKDNKNLLKCGGVMHCFSESAEMAKEYLKLGFYISFAGPVTFKNAKGLLDTAKSIPIDRILSETDCPYLTPHPHRGKLNEPENVSLVVERLSEIRQEQLEYLALKIKENAKALFYKIG